MFIIISSSSIECLINLAFEFLSRWGKGKLVHVEEKCVEESEMQHRTSSSTGTTCSSMALSPAPSFVSISDSFPATPRTIFYNLEVRGGGGGREGGEGRRGEGGERGGRGEGEESKEGHLPFKIQQGAGAGAGRWLNIGV